MKPLDEKNYVRHHLGTVRDMSHEFGLALLWICALVMISTAIWGGRG